MTDRIDAAKQKPEWELAWSSENPGLAAKHERDQLPESRQWERSGFKYGYLAGAKAAEQREASRDAELERVKAELSELRSQNMAERSNAPTVTYEQLAADIAVVHETVAPCEWKSAYNEAVAKYNQAQQKESGEQMSKLGDKYCDGMFRAERCPGSGGECHDDKRPNHLTGYIVCDCGFRCESNDVAAKQRHHGGLS